MAFTKVTDITTPSWTNARGDFKILQEDGFAILLETGDDLLNEIGRGLITWTTATDVTTPSWSVSSEITTPAWSATSEVTTPSWSLAGGWLWENKDINWEDEDINWEDAG